MAGGRNSLEQPDHPGHLPINATNAQWKAASRANMTGGIAVAGPTGKKDTR
jgi:hypothetical protein